MIRNNREKEEIDVLERVLQDMTHHNTSDIAQALSIIASYTHGKGQLPRLDKFLIFFIGLKSLGGLFNIDTTKIIDIDKILREYSVNAPVVKSPLWLEVVKHMSQINTKTEIITQLSKRKKLE